MISHLRHHEAIASGMARWQRRCRRYDHARTSATSDTAVLEIENEPKASRIAKPVTPARTSAAITAELRTIQLPGTLGKLRFVPQKKSTCGQPNVAAGRRQADGHRRGVTFHAHTCLQEQQAMADLHPGELLADTVRAAQRGDVGAYGRLVQATQTMAFAAALGVLRERGAAEDAVQQAYLRAFRRLSDVKEPSSFPSWLRRVVITVALNMRRARRRTLLCLDDVADVPVLDETETRWSDMQRHRLAAALLTLTVEERRLCDRRYHGNWSTARLAAAAGVDEAAMRKRLQRIRDKLRKEIEMTEQREIRAEILDRDLPRTIVELLSRPRLTDLPENPVGSIAAMLHAVYPGFAEQTLPEIVDLDAAPKVVATDAMYVDAHELHRIDGGRILRYDLTLPLLLTCAIRASRCDCGRRARRTACVRPTRRISRRSTRRRSCGWTIATGLMPGR